MLLRFLYWLVVVVLLNIFIRCNTMAGYSYDVNSKAGSTNPGCDAATDFKNTLKSILSTDIESEEETSLTKLDSVAKKSATVTHEFTSKSPGCTVNSRLIVLEKEKGKQYYLTIYLSYGTREDGSKETITIKTTSPSLLLLKAESIIQ